MTGVGFGGIQAQRLGEMGFLRRLFAGTDVPKPVWAIPAGGDLEVAGVYPHHLADLGRAFGHIDEALNEDMPAILVRDPVNKQDPNAVEVRVRGALAGYLPT